MTLPGQNREKDNLLHFDFKNARSLKIYPLEERGPLKWFMFRRKHKIAKALDACEDDLAYMTMVANRRLDKVKVIINESIKNGYHLFDEIFIPEYLGFQETAPENINDIRIYSKHGYNITRVEGSKWLLHGPGGEKIVLNLPNMYTAITVFASVGLNLNITDYIAGKYRDEKPIEDIVREEIQGILENRQKLLEAKT